MKVNYKLYIILFFALFLTEGFGQDGVLIEEAVHDTASLIDKRQIDSKALEEYKLDRDFQYTSGPKSSESLWARIKRHLYDNLIRPLFDAGARGVSQVLMLLLAIGGVALMFFFFFKNRKSSIIDKKDMTWGEVFTNPAEIEEQQFNKWMLEAEAKQDYNEALKYLYLRCIRQMDKKNLILYRPEYTNRQVLNKLKNAHVKEIFGEVAQQFEFVWYGHFTMEQDEYQRLKLLVNKSVLGA